MFIQISKANLKSGDGNAVKSCKGEQLPPKGPRKGSWFCGTGRTMDVVWNRAGNATRAWAPQNPTRPWLHCGCPSLSPLKLVPNLLQQELNPFQMPPAVLPVPLKLQKRE